MPIPQTVLDNLEEQGTSLEELEQGVINPDKNPLKIDGISEEPVDGQFVDHNTQEVVSEPDVVEVPPIEEEIIESEETDTQEASGDAQSTPEEPEVDIDDYILSDDNAKESEHEVVHNAKIVNDLKSQLGREKKRAQEAREEREALEARLARLEQFQSQLYQPEASQEAATPQFVAPQIDPETADALGAPETVNALNSYLNTYTRTNILPQLQERDAYIKRLEEQVGQSQESLEVNARQAHLQNITLAYPKVGKVTASQKWEKYYHETDPKTGITNGELFRAADSRMDTQSVIRILDDFYRQNREELSNVNAKHRKSESSKNAASALAGNAEPERTKAASPKGSLYDFVDTDPSDWQELLRYKKLPTEEYAKRMAAFEEASVNGRVKRT